jgi:hypothetical protein
LTLGQEKGAIKSLIRLALRDRAPEGYFAILEKTIWITDAYQSGLQVNR